MSYDSARGVTVIFGGEVDIGTNYLPVINDTWEWDGANWRQVVIAGDKPPPRYFPVMTYDTARRVHVLYGGYVYGREPGDTYDVPRPVTDTWEYDGAVATWTLRTTNGPSRRSLPGMTYDDARQRTVLFGGELYGATCGSTLDTCQILSDETWLWDGAQGQWQLLSPAHKPRGRDGHAMAYDSKRSIVVCLGGEVIEKHGDFAPNGYPTSETWEWNGTDWSDVSSTANFCCSRDRIDGMGYDAAREQMLTVTIVGGGTVPERYGSWAYGTGNGQFLNYVDWSNPFFLEDGSLFFPYRAVGTAVGCTFGTGTISIQSGDYAEGSMVIKKELRLEARNGPVHIH
jgi:hypothetical protein